jgi:hypothetical protein
MTDNIKKEDGLEVEEVKNTSSSAVMNKVFTDSLNPPAMIAITNKNIIAVDR